MVFSGQIRIRFSSAAASGAALLIPQFAVFFKVGQYLTVLCGYYCSALFKRYILAYKRFIADMFSFKINQFCPEFNAVVVSNIRSCLHLEMILM